MVATNQFILKSDVIKEKINQTELESYEVADRANIGRETLKNILENKRFPQRVETINNLCSYLDLDVKDVLVLK